MSDLNAALHGIPRKTTDAVIVSGEIFFLDYQRELAQTSRQRAIIVPCWLGQTIDYQALRYEVKDAIATLTS